MKNRPLRSKYNMRLKTEIQDFLPVIGSDTPSKRLITFNAENLAAGVITYTGDGTLVVDRKWAYKDTSCLKLSLIDGDMGTITINGTWDLKSLSVTDQDYAKVVRTGKSTNVQDRLFFVINEMLRNKVTNGFLYVLPVFYSGTETATSVGASALNDLYMSNFLQKEAAWQKHQTDLVSTRYAYSTGFTDASWETITKIELKIQASLDGGETVDFYIQNCDLALPSYDPYHLGYYVANSYYPDVHEAYNGLIGPVAGNAIFVSQLFGDDANTGTDRTVPVETIEKAITLLTADTAYICVLDSAVYKPLNGLLAGVTGVIPYAATIVADYLETPRIEARGGLKDADNVGARVFGRTSFWRPETGGTLLTVKKDGTAAYTSITAAFAAVSGANDCIEIQDNGVYDEYLDINAAVHIQSAPGYIPTWSHAADDLIVKISAASVRIQGIKFLGSGQTTAKAVDLVAASVLQDCTFTGFNDAKIILDSFVGNTKIQSCLFVDNGEVTTCIEFKDNVIGGDKTITNCRGLLPGVTADSIFIYFGYAKSGETLQLFFNNNQVLGSLDNGAGACIDMEAASGTATTSVAAHLNETNLRMEFSDDNNVSGIYASYNYIHDSAYGIATYKTGAVAIHSNYFKNTGVGVNCGGNTTQAVCANVFYRCSIGIKTDTWTGGGACADLYNIMVECTVAYFTAASWTVLSNLVMVNCTTGVHLATALALVLNSCIKYNSPSVAAAGTVTDGTDITTASPNFKNPYLDDFSWDGLSSMEAYPSVALNGLYAFINPTTNNLSFKYMELVGPVAAKMLASDSVQLLLSQTSITGALIGINETTAAVTETCVLLDSNGIGARLKLTSVHTNVIAKNNNVGVLVKGPTSFVNVTCTENGWGVTVPHFGLYAQRGCVSAAFLNCVFVKNTSYDYAVYLDPTNCVFYKAYYSVTPSKYSNQLLDPTYLYPATRRIGYDMDNAAYRMSTITDENIGARNLNIVSTNLEGQEYEFFYIGTINNNDLLDAEADAGFMALENPQNIDHSIVPVAGSAARRLDGVYMTRPSAYPRELTLRWSSPSGTGKINRGKTAVEDIYKSYWVVGLSFDMGVNWSWYKVKKDSPLTMSQASYYHDWQAWGDTQLTLVLLENFNIVDYVGC